MSASTRQSSSQAPKARLWLYSRDLKIAGSVSSATQGPSTGGPKSLKHWALVLDYMSVRNPDRVNKRILYEANNEEGLLVAREFSHGEDEEDEWNEKPGFKKKNMGLFNIDESKAKFHCEDFNNEKIKYVTFKDNCQRFVQYFTANVFPDDVIPLPVSAKETKSWFDSVSSASSASLINFGSAKLIKHALVKKAALFSDLWKMAIENINMNGFGKVNLLSEGPVKEFMEQEGKQLVKAALGEATENMINFSRGAFTWWNLLQIPVEIIVSKLMKSLGFNDLEAYAGKKLASFTTAAVVGFCAGGPYGLLGSLALWIAAEIVATIFKLIWNKLFGTGMLGESDTVNLIKSIFRYFQEIGVNFMVKYMKSTQNSQKKLA